MGLFNKKGSENADEMTSDFHFPTSKKALIIFARNPKLGTCKTRLAKRIGDQAALNIYIHLLKHTAATTQEIQVDKFVFYSQAIHKNDLWNASIFKKRLQQGNDLGERMQNAFMELLGLGYEKVIIVGSDLLDLRAKHIQTAFDYLDKNDVVIGPAKDGGYYLLGMKNLHPSLFKNKAWGTSTVLKNTLDNLKEMDFSILEPLNDIDTFEDVKDYKELEIYYT